MKTILRLFLMTSVVSSLGIVSANTCPGQMPVKIVRSTSRALKQVPKVKVPRTGLKVYRGNTGFNSGFNRGAGANVHVNAIQVPKSSSFKAVDKAKYLAPLTHVDDGTDNNKSNEQANTGIR